jgi:hypothetical protein
MRSNFVNILFFFALTTISVNGFAQSGIKDLTAPANAPKVVQQADLKKWNDLFKIASEAGLELVGDNDTVRYLQKNSPNAGNVTGVFRYFSLYGALGDGDIFDSKVVSLVWENRYLSGDSLVIDQWQVLIDRDGQLIYVLNMEIVKDQTGGLQSYKKIEPTVERAIEQINLIIEFWITKYKLLGDN